MSDNQVMDRPGIHEHDGWSYLEAAINAHDVLDGDENSGLRLDGCPAYDYEAFNLAPELCRRHAEDLARSLGFEGPMLVPTAYQPGHPFEPESVMVRRVDGRVTQIACYDYGRAYFEPDEPRTQPCEVCGEETLRSIDE